MKYGLFIVLLLGLISCGRPKENLYLVKDDNDDYGYVDYKGDTVIPMKRYPMCFTDTFKNFAIVAAHKHGFVVIDRKEQIQYHVFPFDNGPDYLSEGMFRIEKNGKIGFADSTFAVKIPPQYGCAFPFENGVAKVSYNCKTVRDSIGEHSTWVSDNWFYINKAGIKVKN